MIQSIINPNIRRLLMNINFNLSETTIHKIEAGSGFQETNAQKPFSNTLYDKLRPNEPEKTTSKGICAKLLNKVGIDLEKKEINKKAIAIATTATLVILGASVIAGVEICTYLQTGQFISNLKGTSTSSLSHIIYQFPPKDKMLACLIKEGVHREMANSIANYPFVPLDVPRIALPDRVRELAAIVGTDVLCKHPPRSYFDPRGGPIDALVKYDASFAKEPTETESDFALVTLIKCL